MHINLEYLLEMKKLLTVGLGLFTAVGAIYSVNCFIAEDIDDQILSQVSDYNTLAGSQGQLHLIEVQKTAQFFGALYRFKLFHSDQEITLPQCLSAELSLQHSPIEWLQLDIAHGEIELNVENSSHCPPLDEASMDRQVLNLFGQQIITGELTLTFGSQLLGEFTTNGINFVEDDIALTVAPFIYRFEIDQTGFEQHELLWSGFEFLDHASFSSAYGGDLHYTSNLSFTEEFLLSANSSLSSEPIWYSDGQRRSGFNAFEADFSGTVTDGYLQGTGTAKISELTLNNLPIGTLTEKLTLTDFPYQQLSEIEINNEDFAQNLTPQAFQSQMLQIIAGTRVTVEELSLTNNDAELSIHGELRLTNTLNAPLDMKVNVGFNESFIAQLADIRTISSQPFASPNAADFQAESEKVRLSLEQLLEQYGEAGYLIPDEAGGYDALIELISGELIINGISLSEPVN
ncbi:DUF945 family protein [uncultured Umboniibacter sp.]|uniref:DUF945 family protein n=1 Tax=uncultured Umboniibacter sp. TaxID=1798917 RepID=UPI0026065D7D|nr:DUF945 family protein [uncultured Umboniibacter sp.]